MDESSAFADAVRHHKAGALAEAEALYRHALRRQPDSAEALQLLGLLNSQLGRASVGAALIKKALVLRPEDPRLHNNLGNVLCSQGLPHEAAASFRRALDLSPHYPLAHSNLLVTLHYRPCGRPSRLGAGARSWGRRRAGRPTARPPHHDSPAAGRRLRLGYLSGELRRHPVGYFLESVLGLHDRAEVEFFFYDSGAI